jgi:hypothetical protein
MSDYRECGCVVKEWSTNQYATVSYCVHHYDELGWTNQRSEVVTDDDTLVKIEEYYKVDDEPDEPEYEGITLTDAERREYDMDRDEDDGVIRWWHMC